ncbi:CoA transferase subunit A [Eubacterium oxidoreducens]|uniref:Acetate CoA/acetoacetate CoA-transferase alpha subunit n=1 Tax=Eubacterium oxidoreducens TaxID=1732 RepID=A0A1G6BC13_EUBOX|nr:CoA transferase subunit A [Eubacterium oxidoreducens]SDB18158.1 acetate CoA/acetoacetate CoA-transferase alpha subunit [Eubacterium oxidoreducens]
MAKTKVISAKEAAALIKDGDTVMIGGFMTNGTAKTICNEVTAKNLTVVCNDGGFENEGTGRLLHNGCIKRLIATHVGLNKEVATKFNDGSLDLKLQPQGTLAEQIRAGGAGLGGFLTPTGVGTIVADSSSPTTLEGKEVVELDGKEYVLEKAIKGDVAIVQAYVADESGNLRYKGSTRNFNPLMASAATITIAEVEKIVPAGEIGPDYVETPHVYVDYLVVKEEA